VEWYGKRSLKARELMERRFGADSMGVMRERSGSKTVVNFITSGRNSRLSALANNACLREY
jgi:hypothetical protein